MFDTLFRYPAIVARHQGGRFAAARELFLNHCAGQGMAHATLQRYAQELLVVAERRDTVLQIRSVVMIALLAICRKVIILDLSEIDAMHIVAFAAAILALGVVYWLMRDSDAPTADTAKR